MKIQEHIPTFISGYERQEAQVKDWLEIIALPWVERWIIEPGWTHWSLSRHYVPGCHLLMAEFRGKAEWYVAARIFAQEGELKRLAILPEFDPESGVKNK